jgi:hypothetical protein
MIAFPEACDALVAAFSQASGIDVFDGPPARLPGSRGIAVGAAREDVSSEWLAPAVDLGGGFGEDLTVTCLAWSGGGGVVFKPHRDAVRGLLDVVVATLGADPTIGGAVDAATLTGGTWTQEQTGEGALVTCEFRVSLRRF